MMCACVCVCVCLHVCLGVLCSCVCLCLCACVSLSMCVACLCVFCLHVFACLCLHVRVFPSSCCHCWKHYLRGHISFVVYRVKYHLYADDIELYVSLDPENKADVSSSLENLENCIAHIQIQMTSNFSKLNENKTSVRYMASPYYSKYLKTPDLQTGESSISPTDLEQNIGVTLDKLPS